MSEFNHRGSVVERVLGGSPLGVLLRLIVLSFVVGVVLTVLDINPADIVRWVEDRLRYFSSLGFDTVEEAVRILILGAVVVVPVWLVLRVLRLMSR
ncbi:DUF6460 domain-containing protein [Acuticoccus mangrovi]|uniref:Integrase n=1 Tax=Acuticoccus mangrovi TaxID=2796142 RepID=A0A934MDA8_9HYPH|nr:DUF6460 domain-containing protein [Acuticoccus mangrovi]MBJ3776142.1 integrase [Acuticoccus mangrovi]